MKRTIIKTIIISAVLMLSTTSYAFQTEDEIREETNRLILEIEDIKRQTELQNRENDKLRVLIKQQEEEALRLQREIIKKEYHKQFKSA